MTFDDFKAEWLSDTPYILARTSGSTGKPKEIMLDKEFVARSARATNSFFSLTESSRFHSCVAPDFIGGKMMLVRAVIAGGEFSYEPPSNRSLTGLSASDHIDLLAVVPSQMHHILDNQLNIPEIKNILIGGSAIPEGLRNRIAISGLKCFESYGMTETSSHIALRPILPGKTPLPFELIGDVTIEADSCGCLLIKYPDGLLIATNDIVEIISPRQFFVRGRYDDVIISGGKKLHPVEIEAELSRISGVVSFLSSIPDEKWGERAVAAVTSESDRAALLDALPDFSLPHWMMPKEVINVGSFPLTDNGKTNRPALKEILLNFH